MAEAHAAAVLAFAKAFLLNIYYRLNANTE
jgi:hypothetical protein